MTKYTRFGYYESVFFATGVGVTLLGCVLPFLAPGKTDTELGLLASVQFTGQMTGTLFLSKVPARSLLLGVAISAVTALLVGVSGNLSPWVFFLYGFGLSLAMSAVNTMAAQEATISNRTSRLERLNLFWPIGAISSAASVHFAAQRAHPLTAYTLCGSALLLCIPSLLHRVTFRHSAQPTLEAAGGQSTAAGQFMRLLVVCFCAVGIETSLSVWAPSITVRVSGVGFPSYFGTVAVWLGIILGRLAASSIFLRLPKRPFLLCAAFLTLGSTLILMTANTSAVSLPALFAASLSIAPTFPSAIADAAQLSGIKFMFLSAGLGAAVCSGAIGFLSHRFDSLALASGVVLAASSVALLITTIANRLPEPQESEQI